MARPDPVFAVLVGLGKFASTEPSTTYFGIALVYVPKVSFQQATRGRMYLTDLIVENSGPVRRLRLTPAFSETARPKPLVLVGANGGGKTNILSLIADALFEAAAIHYTDVLPHSGQSRSWFRVVGGVTTSLGAGGGFSLLEFKHADSTLVYKEKAGTYPAANARPLLPEALVASAVWADEGNLKEFPIPDEVSRDVFLSGAYAYFPASRSEIPFWMNRTAVNPEFKDERRFANRLDKPIFVERSLHGFKQWLMSVMLDARSDVVLLSSVQGIQIQPVGNVQNTLSAAPILAAANDILRKILGDPEVRFAWLGRRSNEKVGVAKRDQLLLPNLDALSSGQSILLGVFGTLLKYADLGRLGRGMDLAAIEGICLIDEVDAHVHIDLQTTVLPSLIALFPKVQFIVTSHSPLFAIGMAKQFGADGFQLIEMPEGTTVTSESYAEFARAFEVLSATETFTAGLAADAGQLGRPLVYVEGETDEPYLKAAAVALGREGVLGRCEIRWIGAKDENGQGFHTGKDAMKHTLAMLRANPQLAARPVLLLNDNDTATVNAEHGQVWVRKLPLSAQEKRIKAGIENLLPVACITDQDYQERENRKPNGDVIKSWSLRKTALCERLCGDPQAAVFAEFTGAIDLVEEFLNGVDAEQPNASGVI